MLLKTCYAQNYAGIYNRPMPGPIKSKIGKNLSITGRGLPTTISYVATPFFGSCDSDSDYFTE